MTVGVFDRRSFLRVGTLGLVGAMGAGVRAQVPAGLPALFHLALTDSAQGGFDHAMAIKEAFSWNHYAERDIS